MAKYMLTANAFIEGRLLEATIESPIVLNLPNDYDPSLLWKPLDQGAVDALTRLADGYAQSSIAEGMPEKMAKTVYHKQIKKPPPGAKDAVVPAETVMEVVPVKARTPEDVENAAFKAMVDEAKVVAGGTEVTVIPAAGRPSDNEPDDPTIVRTGKK